MKYRQNKKYEVIKEMSVGKYSIQMLCKIAGVSKSGYYKWLKRQVSPTEKQLEDEEIKKKIMECHEKFKGTYGYRRIQIWLEKTYELPCLSRPKPIHPIHRQRPNHCRRSILRHAQTRKEKIGSSKRVVRILHNPFSIKINAHFLRWFIHFPCKHWRFGEVDCPSFEDWNKIFFQQVPAWDAVDFLISVIIKDIMPCF